MIINFLQSRDSPILPSLQRLDDSFRSTVHGKPSPFADDIDKLKSRRPTNNESLGSLLFHFFRYYGYELDYSESVVSVKEGRVLTRKEKGWAVTNYQDKEARVRLCVEEPFNTNRNLGNSADDYAFSGIHEEIRRAFDLIAAGKLDECCTEYIFPPEEKPLFQRPAPKPKPILTRSASQSGRAHANSVGAKSAGKESRNNRTSSNHRGNNRRASSGATFGNPRFAFMSPPVGMAGADYFGTPTAIPNEQLHEQLYKQYQFLQAQQELLRSQLLQQQQQNQVHIQAAQAHAQAHGLRTSDFSAASPRQRQFAHSVSSPRSLDTPPATAPLLPGYLYHYPARHAAPASPLSQTRSQEGSATNPSSPSVSSSAAALRRGAQRANVAEGTAPASIRSQSQPGRSFPSPATLQSVAHPGFDVSGAIGSPYLVRQPLQMYPHQQNGYDVTAPLSAGGYPVHFDSAMPKEYVGYYLGQSPQLLPQQPLNAPSQVPILRDVKPRQPRTSPDRLPPNWSNGTRKKSRSPSPLAKRRSSSVSTSSRSAPLPQTPFPEVSQPKARHPKLQDEGPVIVNGSTSQAGPVIAHSAETANTTPAKKASQGRGQISEGSQDTTASTEPHTPERKSRIPSHKVTTASPANVEPSRPVSISDEELRGTRVSTTSQSSDVEKPAATVLNKPEGIAGHNLWHPGTNISANIRARPPPPLNLSPAKVGGDESLPSPVESRATQISPLVAPPLLSPVAELQTPSPTSSRGHGSPHNEAKANANMNKNVQIANGKLNERVNAIMTNGSSSFGHRLMPENPQPSSSIQVQQSVSTGNTYQPGEWQQATRKNKKGKPQGVATSEKVGTSVSGEAPPGSENERKGG
ncbi:hypothetical protein K461DRAFT_102537 [Myriangium duriaei CBS 260.36]|uniref:PAP-associated domain-containing protein n=1 Tax=Myriangium duriaei CBS 260.36 TaxID=1168546 RepID=A0A9P4J4S7_9PEZI|nr:hypothetical protein K461DRAFT_102537 [Myriangium duriaei CBS 260.36]